jgi:chitinase
MDPPQNPGMYHSTHNPILDPVADDRSPTGQYNPADVVNFVSMMTTCRSVFRNRDQLLTMTIPAGYWYLRGFDVKTLEDQVDWFNLMVWYI